MVAGARWKQRLYLQGVCLSPLRTDHHASGFAPTNMFSLTPCTKWVFPLPLLLRWR